MNEPHWLTTEEILLYHQKTLQLHGGSVGVREESLLESAVARPRNMLTYGDGPSLFSLAAAYAFGIVKNHPFVDGNKRTGALVIRAFLFTNGVQFYPEPSAFADMIERLAAGKLSEAELTAMIEDWST